MIRFSIFGFIFAFHTLRLSRSASAPVRSQSDSSLLSPPVSASGSQLCRYPFQTHKNSLERALKAWWCASDVTAKIGNGLLKAKLPCFDWTSVLNVQTCSLEALSEAWLHPGIPSKAMHPNNNLFTPTAGFCTMAINYIHRDFLDFSINATKMSFTSMWRSIAIINK